jgi:hypothetical protein
MYGLYASCQQQAGTEFVFLRQVKTKLHGIYRPRLRQHGLEEYFMSLYLMRDEQEYRPYEHVQWWTRVRNYKSAMSWRSSKDDIPRVSLRFRFRVLVGSCF